MKYNDFNLPCICMQTNSTCYKKTRTMQIKGILWHCTGANNPNLKRYVQPDINDVNYNYLIDYIGVNNNGNDYNHASYQSGLNAWIGKTAKGNIATVQTMPWNYRPWGCGSGNKGTCNDGWIQFECCEDSLTDANYFNAIYKEACELTAYLCKKYNLNPKGYTTLNGVKVPVILCHQDSCHLGLGSNHGDVYNWFNRYGKTMDNVRNDVAALMNENTTTTVAKKEEEEVTQEQFNEMMNVWIADSANKQPGEWSAEARNWATANGLVQGDEQGRQMWKKNMTREEFVTVLSRLFNVEDSKVGDWSVDARDWAETFELVVGDGEKKGWMDYITKEQLVTILYRFRGLMK